MDFTLLSRLRTRRYQYRILAFAFACIAFGITSIFFWQFQSRHVQYVWNFKNVGSFWNEKVDLDSNVTYRITWEEPTSIPYLMTINDTDVSVPNIKFWCSSCYNYSKYVIFQNLTSPFYLKLSNPTILGLNFKKVKPPDHSKPFGEFMEDWFESWFDGVAPHKWKVERIQNNDKPYLLFDKSIPIIRNKNVR